MDASRFHGRGFHPDLEYVALEHKASCILSEALAKATTMPASSRAHPSLRAFPGRQLEYATFAPSLS